MKTETINWPAVNCQCMLYPEDCVCPPCEMALRAWAKNRLLYPMTPEQREFCLSEIDSVEGYSRTDYEEADDRVLASAVLTAWQDYCRDKGLC